MVAPVGLDDELEDGTTMGLPRLELIKGLEVLETLEVGILCAAVRFGGLLA